MSKKDERAAAAMLLRWQLASAFDKESNAGVEKTSMVRWLQSVSVTYCKPELADVAEEYTEKIIGYSGFDTEAEVAALTELDFINMDFQPALARICGELLGGKVQQPQVVRYNAEGRRSATPFKTTGVSEDKEIGKGLACPVFRRMREANKVAKLAGGRATATVRDVHSWARAHVEKKRGYCTTVEAMEELLSDQKKNVELFKKNVDESDSKSLYTDMIGSMNADFYHDAYHDAKPRGGSTSSYTTPKPPSPREQQSYHTEAEQEGAMPSEHMEAQMEMSMQMMTMMQENSIQIMQLVETQKQQAKELEWMRACADSAEDKDEETCDRLP